MAHRSDEYVSGDMRGAHLKLAQRHRVIVAGQFHGRKKLEPEFAHPGVTGQLALSFSASTALPVEARITCVLPDHGWGFPSGAINAVLRLAQGLPTSAIQAAYASATRTLELTLLSEPIPAGVPVTVVLSGITTPVSATPTGEAVVTSYEKLIVRNTVPPSTRGGQVLDGPTTFTIPSIMPGELTGSKKWQPFNCCPSAVSDVTLSFNTHGCIPMNGKILVELPADGWDMDDSPQVLLRTSTYHNESVVASWRREQRTLEVGLGSRSIKNGTSMILTVRGVKNPDKETMNDSTTSSGARVTTLVAAGSVIDGPSKVEVARISELRERDFLVAKQAFDEVCADGSTTITVDKLPDMLRRTGIVLSAELYETLVVANLPRADSVENDSSSTDTSVSPQEITRPEFLNLFSQICAPAYKFGQELRLACGRGDVGRIHEYISRGCDANAKDGSGWGALHYAADYGHVASIDAIVEAMASAKNNQNQNQNDLGKTVSLQVNLRDLSGWTPLLCAAANGHTHVVHKLLSLGADLSIASVDGRTALHWAATRGMDNCVAALIAAGATTNSIDRNGWTPLHCASLHSSDKCMQILREQGANVDCKDRLHHTPDRFSQDPVCDTQV